MEAEVVIQNLASYLQRWIEDELIQAKLNIIMIPNPIGKNIAGPVK